MAARAIGALRQVLPAGPTLRFQFDPEELTPSGGVGGWDEVAHPRAVSSTEWRGTPLRSVTFELLFDGFVGGRSVEEPLRILNTWGRKHPGYHQPAVLQLVYGDLSAHRWVLNELTHGDTLRDEAGKRIRAAVTVTLLEHISAQLALSPAKTVGSKPPAKGSPPKPSGRVYTVRKGDTLSKIAQQQLGKASRWPEIAKLNNLRDPDRIYPGQRLRLPA